MRNSLAIKALLFFLLLSGLQAKSKPDPFVLFSLAKSGTHLAEKCIYMLIGYTPTRVKKGDIKNVRKQIIKFHSEGKYPIAHFHHSGFIWIDSCLQENRDIKKIITVRNLRDVAVSGMNHFLKEGLAIEEFTRHINISPQRLKNMSTDDQLTIIIKHVININSALDKLYQCYREPSTFVIRYEDLVGSKGGGSDERMKKLITELAEYLNITLTEKRLSYVQKNLYGNQPGTYNSVTFRKGKIGQWKEYFKKQHMELFDSFYGDHEKVLGY